MHCFDIGNVTLWLVQPQPQLEKQLYVQIQLSGKFRTLTLLLRSDAFSSTYRPSRIGVGRKKGFLEFPV